MKPLIRRLLDDPRGFAVEMAWSCWRALWLGVKDTVKLFAIMAVVFYLWASYGDGQPQHFLRGHEFLAEFNRIMARIHDGGCP